MIQEPDIAARPPYMKRLSEEAMASIEEAPRQERINILANHTGDSEDEIIQAIAKHHKIDIVSSFIPDNKNNLLPLRIIHDYQCLPIVDPETNDDEITLVTLWPTNRHMDKWVRATTGMRPKWKLASAEAITETIADIYGVGSGSLDDTDLDDLMDDDGLDDDEDENAAIIRFINEIVQRAVNERATDIHFEPQKDTLQIRFRIDGQLEPVRLPENLRQFQGAIISRLKIMAKLNISEKRRPQDGRISFQHKETPIDIRISTLPTMYGESISLRLLNQSNKPLTVKDLGLLGDDEVTLMKTADRPHGIILVTGPTGSGKSTTLTAVIRKIHSPERRIITVEDPVEYEVPGVNQTQVHSEIGLDFAAALRTVLRQDPDVIMVGEIRDRETADIGIRASLTGHLVLSTLHTNDSAGALVRLTDMGIEPFLIASSVELIIAQRLVRRINPDNRFPAHYDAAYIKTCLSALGVSADEIKNTDKLMAPRTKIEHPSAGFHGRIGLFELLPVSERIHELIVEKGSARLMREQGIKEGMRTLQQCGWEQCKRGLTTLGEVMKYANLSEDA